MLGHSALIEGDPEINPQFVGFTSTAVAALLFIKKRKVRTKMQRNVDARDFLRRALFF